MLNKRKYNIYRLISFVALLFLFFSVAASAQATGFLWDKIGTCQSDGDCKLNDFAQLAVNVSQWILGVTGSLSLLAFVYGGILFLTSAGSNEQVAKGKQAITGAVIGLVVVFASYLIIGFVFKAMGASVNDTAWATTGWFGK